MAARAMSVPSPTPAAVDADAQLEEFALTFVGRLSAVKSLEAQAFMLRAGIDLTRQLLARRASGVAISDETVDMAFEALFDGVDQMIELMPPAVPFFARRNVLGRAGL